MKTYSAIEIACLLAVLITLACVSPTTAQPVAPRNSISLRDYFAGCYLTGRPQAPHQPANNYVRNAYRIADFMLIERAIPRKPHPRYAPEK